MTLYHLTPEGPWVTLSYQLESRQRDRAEDGWHRERGKEGERWFNGRWKAHRGLEQTAMGGVEIKNTTVGVRFYWMPGLCKYCRLMRKVFFNLDDCWSPTRFFKKKKHFLLLSIFSSQLFPISVSLSSVWLKCWQVNLMSEFEKHQSTWCPNPDQSLLYKTN